MSTSCDIEHEAAVPTMQPTLQEDNALSLLDLPEEVLTLCMQGLCSPGDLASLALACKRLARLGAEAPVGLRLQEPHLPPCTPAEARHKLRGIWSCFPGAAQLDASGCPLEDGDIEQLLGRLPGLHVLLLSGCKKLTGAACKLVFGLGGSIPASAGSSEAAEGAATSQQQQQAHRLRTAVMQRCFQLTAEALSDALLAGMQHSGAGGGSSKGSTALEGVALSHLDLKQWPSEPVLALVEARSMRSRGERAESSAPKAAATAAAAAAAAAAGEEGIERAAVERPRAGLPAPGLVAGLRALALHNCTGLTMGALQAVAASCPALEALFLGGSSLALQEAAGSTMVAAAGGTDAAGGEARGAGQQAQQLQLLPMGTAAGTGGIELAPGPALPDAFMDCQGSMHSMQGVRRGAAAAIARLRLSRLADPLIQSAAAELAAVAAVLPRLRLLEFSFALPGLVPLLQSLAEEPGAWAALAGRRGSAASQPPLVWDLCQPDSVRQALTWRRAVAAGNASGPSEVAVLLRAAANCSSGAKVTPLHVAAEEGRCSMAQDLLALGADVLARDRSGASPLFRACEAGHLGMVACLLRAGADVTQRNSSGEAPLYISALRGHGGVVGLLLEHCQAAGVCWEDPAYYGDGWTPLMAGAVGNRAHIVRQLLSAAGPLAPALVRATNRYGQTAVHIAARKGSWDLVQYLVEAGGGAAVAGVVDGNGHLAVHIARRCGNTAAWEVLRAYMSEGEVEEEGAKGRRGRRARKAAVAAAATAAAPAAGHAPGGSSQAGQVSTGGPSGASAARAAARAAAAAAAGSSSSGFDFAGPSQLSRPAGQWVGRRLGARKSEAAAQ